MKLIKQVLGGAGAGRQLGMVGALVAILLFFQYTTDGKMLSSENIINLVQQYSFILLLAIGMVMVIIAGHIDLSVGSVAAFSSIVVALSMRDNTWTLIPNNLPWVAAIIFGLFVGALIGAWQGFWVAYVGVPAFIVTLAGMLIFRGANQFVGKSTTTPVPGGFKKIGAGYLPEWGPDTGYNNSTLLIGALVFAAFVYKEVRGRMVKRQLGVAPLPMWVSVSRLVLMAILVGLVTQTFAGGRVGTSFPISGCILGGLVLVYGFLTRNTVLGRHIYAVGGNKHAAELSGVKAKRIDFFVMLNMSMLAALAGMMYAARSGASGPQDGLNWELEAISAVFIGGAAVSGGVGTVVGSIIGGLVMAALNSGLQLEGVGIDFVQMIKGLVLLLAVAIDVRSKQQGGPSLIGAMMRRLNIGGSSSSDSPASATTITPSAPDAVSDREPVSQS